MTPPPRRRGPRSRAVRGAAVLGAVVLLAGCGTARPGVAAQIGAESVSVSDVDSASIAFCEWFAVAQPGNVVPMRLARDVMLASLIERSIGDQIAEEYDVAPGAEYEALVTESRTQLATLPEDQQEAVLIQQTAAPYRQAVTQAAAAELLAAEGVAAPTPEQLQGRATLLGAQWSDSNDVVVDPRFSIAVENGAVTDSGDTSVSFPVSTTAVPAASTDLKELTAQAASLPTSQRCGG